MNTILLLFFAITMFCCSTHSANNKFKAGGPLEYPKATVHQWEQYKLYSIVYFCVRSLDEWVRLRKPGSLCGAGTLIEGENRIWWVLTAAHSFQYSFETISRHHDVPFRPCNFRHPPVYRIKTKALVFFNTKNPPTNNIVSTDLQNNMLVDIAQIVTRNQSVTPSGDGNYLPANDDHLIIPYQFLVDAYDANIYGTRHDREKAADFDIALFRLGTIDKIRSKNVGNINLDLFSGTLTGKPHTATNPTGRPRIPESLTVFGYGARYQNLTAKPPSKNYLGGGSNFKTKSMQTCVSEEDLLPLERLFTHFFCYNTAYTGYSSYLPGIMTAPGDSGAPIFCEDHKICGMHVSSTVVKADVSRTLWPNGNRLPNSFGIRVDKFCNWIKKKIGGPQTNFGCD